jgi:DNA primase catalytic subunit
LFGSDVRIAQIKSEMPPFIQKSTAFTFPAGCNTSIERWIHFHSRLMEMCIEKPSLYDRVATALYSLVLSIVWPKLDVAVTVIPKHLIKLPFCVHPSSGRVCVPLVLSTLTKTDITKLPTLEQLFDEANHSTESKRNLLLPPFVARLRNVLVRVNQKPELKEQTRG